MGNAERRNKIIKMLRIRRYERIDNLAFEFGVSTRTIRRDIAELSLTEPIYTKCGRYGGGVYYLDAYNNNYILISCDEAKILNKILQTTVFQNNPAFSKNELQLLDDIIHRLDI